MAQKTKPAPRNTLVLAMTLRHGGGSRPMKHRTTPRGGSRNKQRDYLKDG